VKVGVVLITVALLLFLYSFLYIPVSTGNGGVLINVGRPVVLKAGNVTRVVLGGEVIKIAGSFRVVGG